MAEERRAQLCVHCRKLVSSDETVCPHCGAKNPTLWGLGAQFQRLLAGQGNPVFGVVAVCVVLYAITLIANPAHALSGGLMNIGSPASPMLYLFGMTGGAAWEWGHWWTLLTANYLHGGLLHIVFNVIWLNRLGTMVSMFLGPARFIIVFTVTGVSGFLLSNLYSGVPTIGASCSILGLIGMLIGLSKRWPGSLNPAAVKELMGCVVFCLFIGFVVPNVNNAGHVGGFLGGLLLAQVFPRRKAPEAMTTRLVASGMVLMTVGSFALSLWTMWGPVFNN